MCFIQYRFLLLVKEAVTYYFPQKRVAKWGDPPPPCGSNMKIATEKFLQMA